MIDQPLYPADKAYLISSKCADRLCHSAIYARGLPCGHPEGFIEVYANLYKNLAAVLLARRLG